MSTSGDSTATDSWLVTLNTSTVYENVTSNYTTSATHQVHHEKNPTAILFIFVSCAFGALVRTLFKRFRIPYTVILLILGLLLGFAAHYVPTLTDFTSIAHMDPHTILHVFLPVLVFESAFAMETHLFLKSFMQIVILAIPGLALSALLTAVFAMNMFAYNWNWTQSMMFGAIVSATDPVAVVALLKDLGISKQLQTLIEGESLLNDGAAIVMYEVFKELSLPGADAHPGNITLKLLIVVCGGPLFGYVMAKLTILWLVNIFNDALTEITITLAATYITYYVGDVYLKVSGVLSVVVLGVTMNAERTSISPEVDAFLHRFWEMAAYLANTLIFILVGVVIIEKSLEVIEVNDMAMMAGLYCAVFIFRGVTIAMFSPILTRIGYGLTWRDAVVMTWGGLRGAVGLALALAVSQIEALDYSHTLQNKVLIQSAGIVMLTLIINASTMAPLLKILGLSEVSIPKRLAMASAVRNLNDVVQTSTSMYKSDRFLADADWDIVIKYINIKDPYQTLDEEAEIDHLSSYHRTSRCPVCESTVPNEPSKKELDDMKNEARLRLLKAEKVSYWKQFEHGMLSREAVRKLTDAVDAAVDKVDGFINIHDIQKSWTVTGMYPYIKKKLEKWLSGKLDGDIIPPPERLCMINAYRVCMHSVFDIILNIVIFLNLIIITLETVAESTMCAVDFNAQYAVMFQYTNYVFIVIYTVEAILKIIAFRKHYFLSHWHQFDFAILLLSFGDIILDLALFLEMNTVTTVELDNGACDEVGAALPINPTILRVARGVRLLRLLRSLRLVKGLIPQLIDVVNLQINKKLRFGYDVGKGYVSGEEEVHNLIDHLIDNKTIATHLKDNVVAGRLEIIKELAMLQSNHPGIAVSIKTQQAARRILNNLRDKIEELRSEGVLDETEAAKLGIMIETRMKKLLKIRATIKPPPPEKIIGNLSWVGGDAMLIEYIKHNAILVSMSEGEQLFVESDPKGGVYVIISGLIKVDKYVEQINMQSISDVHRSASYVTTARDRRRITHSTKEKISDYLSTGAVLGEMALLTGKPNDVTIRCDTSVQMYHIPYDAIQAALELFIEEPSMEFRLWRVCGIRVATRILRAHPFYMNWNLERIQLHLEKCDLFLQHIELPEGGNFDAPFEMFEIDTSYMSDIVLVHGVVEDATTGNQFTGPCYISNRIEQLLLIPGKTEAHVIVIVPREGVMKLEHSNTLTTTVTTEEIASSKERRKSSFIGDSGSVCLLHAAQSRARLRNQIDAKIQEEEVPTTVKLKNSLTRILSKSSKSKVHEMQDVERDANDDHVVVNLEEQITIPTVKSPLPPLHGPESTQIQKASHTKEVSKSPEASSDQSQAQPRDVDRKNTLETSHPIPSKTLKQSNQNTTNVNGFVTIPNRISSLQTPVQPSERVEDLNSVSEQHVDVTLRSELNDQERTIQASSEARNTPPASSGQESKFLPDKGFMQPKRTLTPVEHPDVTDKHSSPDI